MNPITLTSGNQTVQFTNTDITIDGTVYPYGSISRIWHIPQRSAYAIVSGDQTAAFTYGQKDLPLLQALMDRIGQALQLDVEVYLPAGGDPAAGPAGTERLGAAPEAGAASDQTGTDRPPSAAESERGQEGPDQVQDQTGAGSGMLRDRRFLIELGLGILLILLGVVGFLVH